MELLNISPILRPFLTDFDQQLSIPSSFEIFAVRNLLISLKKLNISCVNV